MRRVLKFLNLSLRDKSLLMKAALLVLAIRTGLTVLPFSALQKLLAKITKKNIARDCKGRPSIDQLAWSVAAASHCIPKASCLTQALALQVLLKRKGYPAILQIGVVKDGEKQFQAHAWVESQGRTINGGSEVGRYKGMLSRHNRG